jgi:membrane protein DedA with SNARE-associated domain
MHFLNFADTLQWVLGHGYALMLAAMTVEGPIVTAAASFAVTLGYFNLPMIFLLSVIGDLFADTIFYTIGYWGHFAIVNKFAVRLGLTPTRLKLLESHLEKHGGKTMAAIKLNPVTPMVGLMLVGAIRMPLKRFVWISMLITIPKTILFMVIGYYFGQVYDSLASRFHLGPYAIALVLLAAAIALISYRFISSRIANSIDTI